METIFFASSKLTIHTYGGGLILQKIFVAISMLATDGGILHPLMFICAALGSGIVICKVLTTLNFDHLLINYFFPFFAIYTAFIIPTTTIHIEDELCKPTIYKVEKVPRLLAHFAEIASLIGYSMTCGFEKAMHQVDDLNFSKTGMIFGSQTALDFRQFQITNPDLQRNLREFSKQCVLYDLALGRYSLDELQKTTNLWNFLKDRSSKLGMVYYCPPKSGSKKNEKCEHLSCQKVLEKFEPHLKKEKEYYAKQEIGKNLPLTFQALTKIKEETEKLISQQLMINVLSEQFNSVKFAQDRAHIQQNSTYLTTGILAAKGIVVMRCVFEAIIYASFLIILPLALLPSGIKLLLNWMWLVLWIQLWPPFYSMLHYIASIVAQYTTVAIQEGLADKGLSIFSSLGLQNFANDTFALAGYLTLSVPYLSYVVLQGGLHQFVQLAGTLTSPSQSAASSAAVEQTTGNYSYDNVSVGQTSYGNTTAFQNNTAPSLSDNYFTENKGFEKIDYTTNGVIYSQNTSNLASSINSDQMFSESVQQQQQHAESYAETTSKQYQDSIAYTANVGSSLISHLAHSENSNKAFSSREAYDSQQAIRHMESSADNWGRQFGLSSKQSLDLALAGAIGGELGINKILKGIVGVGVDASADVSGSYRIGADESRFINAALNFANSQEFSSNFQKVKDFSSSVASSSSEDEGVRLAQDFNQSLNEVQSHQESHQAAKTQLNQISDTSTWFQQNSHFIKDNLNQRFMDWAVDKFNNEYHDSSGFIRLKEMMNSQDPEKSLQMQQTLFDFVHNEMDKYGISSPSHYQEPNRSYDNVHISQVDRKIKIDEIMEDYSHNAEGMDKFYGSTNDQKEKLKNEIKEAKESHDSYSYFTQNEIHYHRKAQAHRFDIEKNKSLTSKAFKAMSTKDETSQTYVMEVPAFWQRRDK